MSQRLENRSIPPTHDNARASKMAIALRNVLSGTASPKIAQVRRIGKDTML
jgi:hypothetical protein